MEKRRIGRRYEKFYEKHPDFPDAPLVGMTALELPLKPLSLDEAGELVRGLEAHLDELAQYALDDLGLDGLVGRTVIDTEPSLLVICSIDKASMLRVDVVFNCELRNIFDETALKAIGCWVEPTQPIGRSSHLLDALTKVNRKLYGICNLIKGTALVRTHRERDKEAMLRSRKQFAKAREGVLGQIMRLLSRIREVLEAQHGFARAKRLEKSMLSAQGYLSHLLEVIYLQEDKTIIYKIVSQQFERIDKANKNHYKIKEERDSISNFNACRQECMELLQQFK